MNTCPTARPGRPFGQVLTAMVSPFDAGGKLDLDAAQSLATHLVDLGNDGLVVNGTTGESPTTSDDGEDRAGPRGRRRGRGPGERRRRGRHLRHRALGAAGARGRAGRRARAARGHAVLLTAAAGRAAGPLHRGRGRSGLPNMLYDIPPRSVVPIEVDTLRRLAEHPRIQAVKDAKGDLFAGSQVIASTDLAYYSGDDALNLPWLSVGGVGFVSVIGHVVAGRLRRLLETYEAGDVEHRPHRPPWTAAGVPGDGPGRRRDLREGRAAPARPRRGRPAAAAAARDRRTGRRDRRGPRRRGRAARRRATRPMWPPPGSRRPTPPPRTSRPPPTPAPARSIGDTRADGTAARAGRRRAAGRRARAGSARSAAT